MYTLYMLYAYSSTSYSRYAEGHQQSRKSHVACQGFSYNTGIELPEETEEKARGILLSLHQAVNIQALSGFALRNILGQQVFLDTTILSL